MRGTLGVVGVFALLLGAVFVGQGTNAIHGSSMSGHGGYAGLGAVLLVVGLGLVVQVWRLRGRRDA